MQRRWSGTLAVVILAALLYRGAYHEQYGQVQSVAFWTLGGRIDQFVLGMLAYRMRSAIQSRHAFAASVFVAFALFWWHFDQLGGFYRSPRYPSTGKIWIYLPAIEGLAYAALIAWYDTSFKHSTGPTSRFLAMIGTVSYSIYLLHFFIVFRLSNWLASHVALGNLHVAIASSIPAFLVMVPIAWASYRWIETPFLRLRSDYVVGVIPPAATSSN